MIALPCLTLPTGKYEVARNILRTFAKHVNQGMLPNRFHDAGEGRRNTTRWTQLSGLSKPLADTLRTRVIWSSCVTNSTPVFVDIISWQVRGTRYGIKVDDTGLLASGELGVQLTWMDAKVGDWVVTPRRGKPIEIQALWYNALCIMEDLAGRCGDEVARKCYRHMATVAHWSFNQLFWNEDLGCLYDVVNGGPLDSSIRPNQIFAVSLPHSLTPFGLRSLAPSDAHYHGCYTGGPAERDGAYHQGTVWP